MKLQMKLFPILLINFIGALGYSIVIPFLVIIVEKFGGNALMYGLISAMYPLFQLIGSPILGNLSDKYGRKPILVLSQIGTLVSWIIFLLALYTPVGFMFEFNHVFVGTLVFTTPLLVLMFARALDGVTGGNVSVAQAYLADVTSNEDRSKSYGVFSLSANLGFVVGPALAGILGSTALNETLPVLAALLISVIGTVAIVFFLPESRIQKTNLEASSNLLKKSIRKEFIKRDHWFYLLTHYKIASSVVIYFLVVLAFNIFYTAFPVHALNDLSWTVGELGVYFSIMAIVMGLVQGPVLSFLSKHLKDVFLILIGSALMAFTFYLYIFDTKFALYFALLTFALGNGLMWPSVLSLMTKETDDDYQGFVQGVAGGGSGLAGIIGLIIGGIFYDQLSEGTFIISFWIFVVVFMSVFFGKALTLSLKGEKTTK